MPQRLVWISGAVLIVLLVGACRTKPILNVADAPLATPPGATLEDVGAAVRRAGAGLGWEMQETGPSEMKGTLNLRKHVAVVNIRYTLRSVSIVYVSSENLKSNGTSIHRNYNNWVNNLRARIQEEVSLGATGG